MPDLCEIVPKVKKNKGKPKRNHNIFYFIIEKYYLEDPLPGVSLGDGLRSEQITLVPLCSPDWLSEVGPDSYVVPLPDRGGGPQIVKNV